MSLYQGVLVTKSKLKEREEKYNFQPPELKAAGSNPAGRTTIISIC